MSNKSNITIAVTTYRRPHLLKKCLNSLCQQTFPPPKIIIIDNDPQKSARSIYNKYQKKLPLKYFFETKKGAPHVRNAAIDLVKTKYIGFIDDDCILDKNWFQKVVTHTQKNNLVFVIGTSLLQNKNNIFAQTQFYYYQQWFNSLVHKHPLPPELFDTKNIIINRKLLKQNKFKFDQIFSNSSISGFEDVDMGYQFANKKLYGLHDPKIIVFHQELDTFSKMTEKSFERGRLKYLLNKKWHIQEKYSNNLLKKLLNTGKKITKHPKKIIPIVLTEIIDYAFKLGYNYQKKRN